MSYAIFYRTERKNHKGTKELLVKAQIENALLKGLARPMADYLFDHEQDDYFEQCEENNKDPYLIDPRDRWHIYIDVLLFAKFSGVELDPQYKFGDAE